MRCATVFVFAFVALASGASVERPRDVPYTIRLRLSSKIYGEEDRYCEGVRLNTDWFLTAAECLDNKI